MAQLNITITEELYGLFLSNGKEVFSNCWRNLQPDTLSSIYRANSLLKAAIKASEIIFLIMGAYR